MGWEGGWRQTSLSAPCRVTCGATGHTRKGRDWVAEKARNVIRRPTLGGPGCQVAHRQPREPAHMGGLGSRKGNGNGRWNLRCGWESGFIPWGGSTKSKDSIDWRSIQSQRLQISRISCLLSLGGGSSDRVHIHQR